MIEFKPFDQYWSTPASVRVNTVNVVGVMGKGIALEFKTRYPDMFRKYQTACNEQEIRPGDVWPYSVDGELLIWCAATKKHWSDPSKYEWVESCIDQMRAYLKDWSEEGLKMSMTLPALGCGNGGLYWPKVRDRIEAAFETLNHDIYVFEPKE